MKIYTLAENTSCNEKFGAEHGLSLMIEASGRRLLFDAGQSRLFAENAELLQVHLENVDTAILSHGHYDHGGGMAAFLEINDRAPLYMNPKAVGEFYNGTEKYIGLPETLKTHKRIRFAEEITDLGNGFTLYPGKILSLGEPVNSFGLNEKTADGWVPDSFLHEQYLLLEEKGKRILFSGCSHRGIVNIARFFQPDILIGGFHFKKLDPQADLDRLQSAARKLSQLPCTYYSCHCTGAAQYAVLKSMMGQQLHYLSAGTVLEM